MSADYSAKPTKIVSKPPSKHCERSAQTCLIEHIQFKAVHTVYACIQRANPGYVLEVMPDAQSEALQNHGYAAELLQCMWEKAETADEGLQQFHWLPAAASTVPLLPRHAIADRVQRRTEHKALKELVESFEKVDEQGRTEQEIVRPFPPPCGSEGLSDARLLCLCLC